MTDPPDLTELLNRLGAGDGAARAEFAPILHAELRRLARSHLAREAANHTLQPTELVHDAWLRLMRPGGAEFASRHHFFALASTLMRSLLVDHARRRDAQRRGGGARAVTLRTEEMQRGGEAEMDVLLVDDALSRLAEMDAELGRIAEMRIFGGVEMDEVAAHVGLPLRTAERRWKAARLWLRKELGGE